MADKLGVYICSGCGIGGVVDTEKLLGAASGAATKQVHGHLCGPEGLTLIRQDLEGETPKVNGVVIAACSPRVKMDAFNFGPDVLVERANIREHVAWCQQPGDEDVQSMAEDYVNMSIARAQKSKPIPPLENEISKKIMVVGGGVTGLTSALEAAAAGYDVLLVEKTNELGGFLATVRKRYPVEPPYIELADGGLKKKIEEVLYNPKIKVCVNAKILKTEGQPGMFEVTLDTPDGEIHDRVGSVVMATGWTPYDAAKLGHLGYGASDNVVTNVELEKLALAGEIKRPSDGKLVQDVLFVQCAGSRDPEHLPYCSSVCCMATLKHAAYFREQNPNARVYIIYKDMRTPGQYEKFYRNAQDDPLNFLTKGEVAGVATRPDGKLSVSGEGLAHRRGCHDQRGSGGSGDGHGSEFRRWSGDS